MARAPSEALPESGTVSVACKLPHGLILELFETKEVSEPVMGGGFRSVQMSIRTGERHVVRGYRGLLFGQVPSVMLGGGYAVTEGVPAQFFGRWLEQNKGHPAVVGNLIWAMGRVDNVLSKAREMEDVRNGMEPIDPKNPPEEFRRVAPWDGSAQAKSGVFG